MDLPAHEPVAVQDPLAQGRLVLRDGEKSADRCERIVTVNFPAELIFLGA
jgi:hypothetical protein